MPRFLRESSLSLVFFALFAAALAGDAVAGWAAFNDDAATHAQETIGFWRYLTTSAFGRDVLENWQSEYLQFTLYILLTVWLLQTGSNESKPPSRAGRESDAEQRLGAHATADSPRWARAGGWRTRLYSNSLVLAMAAIWIVSWAGQSVTGRSAFNSDRIAHHESPLSWWQYVGTAEFWEATLQNWQSEFLAVGTMVVFSIYLRQRGSPESKPVGDPHRETASEG
ncbi:MAG: hypothetical protein IRZ32_14225 [Solirubrobacteraceae bacterium]|nr:hypothetical protein [Solirubrobacteraceae bacterium]